MSTQEHPNSSWHIAQEAREEVHRALNINGIKNCPLPNSVPYRSVVVVDENDIRAVAGVLAGLTENDNWQLKARFPGTKKYRVAESGLKESSPRPEALFFSRQWKAPDGSILNTGFEDVVVQPWRRLEIAEPRPEGGMHSVGTLAPSKTPRTSPVGYFSPKDWERVQPEGDDYRLRSMSPSWDDLSGPFDVVYTWVDDSDPSWQERKSFYLRRISGFSQTSDATSDSRFRNRDELRYSLRSLEMYAGWVRKIFIVTDQQVPEWLNQSCLDVEVVDQREIFLDTLNAPSFNSHAIESALHRIPGLSERYLYLNDDMFFARPTRPDQFFSGNTITGFFLSRGAIGTGRPHPQDTAVTAAAKNNRDFLLGLGYPAVYKKFKHAPYPQNRRVLKNLETRHEDIFRHVERSRFRSSSDYSIASSLYHYYAHFEGSAVPFEINYDMIPVASDGLGDRLQSTLARRDLDVFCLNDTGEGGVATQVESDELILRFLEKMYPSPSRFELAT